MGITVTTPAPTVLLTTRARVAQEIDVSVADEPVVDRLIRDASAAVLRYCHRPFAREAVTELCPGFGDIHLQLSRTPIVAVSSVTVNGSVLPVTDYSIADAMKGWLYRRAGWAWTVQAYPGLSMGGAFMDWGSPQPQQEEPQISVPYTGGYILPPQAHVAAVTVSASAADNSFNDSDSRFPALLKAGDMVEVSGFTNAANNGRFVVSGTPTTAKVVVTATLVTEAVGPGVTISYPEPTGLPADVEKAAVETVKTWFIGRREDSQVAEKQMGPARVRYERGAALSEFTGGVVGSGLPPIVVGLLRPWVRAA